MEIPVRGEGVKVEWALLDRWSCVSHARSSGGWSCAKCCQGKEADHEEGPRPRADPEVKARQLPCRGDWGFGWARREQDPEQRLEKELSCRDLDLDFRKQGQVRNGTEVIVVVAGVSDTGTELLKELEQFWCWVSGMMAEASGRRAFTRAAVRVRRGSHTWTRSEILVWVKSWDTGPVARFQRGE